MTIRGVVSALLVTIAFLNLGRAHRLLSPLPSRHEEELVFLEQRFLPIRYALMNDGYMSGEVVGYMSSEFLKTGKAGPDDEKRWAEARYVMIPWNLVSGTMDASWVVIDFWGTQAQFDAPEGFKKVYESADGLILLRRISS